METVRCRNKYGTKESCSVSQTN